MAQLGKPFIQLLGHRSTQINRVPSHQYHRSLAELLLPTRKFWGISKKAPMGILSISATVARGFAQ
eukprot:734120-Amphidinium_carterae.1